MMRKCLYILIYLSFTIVSLYSQQNPVRPEFFSIQTLNFELNNVSNTVHTSFKPFFISNSVNQDKVVLTDSSAFYDSIHSKTFKEKWFYRKLFLENFVQLNTENFDLKINPLFNLQLKRDDDNTKNLFNNTRGVELSGKLGERIYFYSSFYENQARFEPYVNDYIRNYLVVPGQGAPKFKANDKLDFSIAEGWIFIDFGKYFNLSSGYSKHFIGEGYRSLILSDNSFNYPFLRLNFQFGNFRYSLFWAQHQLFKNVYYDYHFRKYNAISQLSWRPNNKLELSLFESVEWPGNLPGKTNFNIALFNPVMLWRTLQFGLDNEKNVLLGLNAKLRLYKFAQFYSQFVLDNIDSKNKSNNNFAFQLGLKHFDLLHQKLPHQNLFIQLEYNYIAPYTYTQKNVYQSFTHYNQPLAHPAGSGLKESMAIFEYSFKKLKFRVIASHLINSIDTLNSNFGSNVFAQNEELPGTISHIGNKPGQGVKNTIKKLNTELIFEINPSTNMQVFTQMVYRQIKNVMVNQKDLIFSVGFRTNINNYYYDF
jgi:hypothetical protein